MDEKAASFLQKRRLHILVIILLGLLVYSNTFNVPFLFDDQNIIDNMRIREVTNIPSMFIDISGPIASRPLMNATFAVNYWIDGFNTGGYHILNLAIHILNGILLYLLVVMTGRHLGHEDKETIPVALIASMLFVLHPIQTEAVTYIISRSMLLATAFYLLGLMLFLQAVESKNRRGLYMAGLLIVSLMGMASREDFVTFPLMLLLYDLFFISRFNFRDVSRHFKFYLPAILSLGYLAFLVLSFDYPVTAGFDVEGVTPWTYFITQFNVHFTYLRLLLLPLNLNLDYDYRLARTIFEFPTLLSFIGYAGLWAVSILSARKHPLMAFSILWFLIALLPASSVMPLDDLIFEHRLYLPSVGVFAALSNGIYLLLTEMDSRKLRSTVVVSLAILMLVFTGTTYARNTVWLDTGTFWSDVVRKAPGSYRAHNNLGVYYSRIGLHDKALEHLEVAMRLRPDNPKCHTNIGAAYLLSGLPDKAIKHLEVAIILKPDFILPHTLLGVAYTVKEQHEKALEIFLEAARLSPKDPILLNNIAKTYLKLGQKEEAIKYYIASLSLNKEQTEGLENLSTLFIETGQEEHAIPLLTTLVELDPGNMSARIALSKLYIEMGHYRKAIEHLDASLEIEPDNPEVHLNLARAFKAVGEESKALEHSIKAEALENSPTIEAP